MTAETPMIKAMTANQIPNTLLVNALKLAIPKTSATGPQGDTGMYAKSACFAFVDHSE